MHDPDAYTSFPDRYVVDDRDVVDVHLPDLAPEAHRYVTVDFATAVVDAAGVVGATWGPAVDNAEWFVAFRNGPAYRVADRAAGLAELHRRFGPPTPTTDGSPEAPHA